MTEPIRAVVVQYTTRPDAVDENQQLVEAVYAELAQRRPDGFQYATYRLDDGVTFVHVAVNERPDGTNPLDDVRAFGDFNRGIEGRCTTPPVVRRATCVGSYRSDATQEDTP